MMFWLIYRIYEVKDVGNVYQMAHYMSDMFDPRPEMYKYVLNKVIPICIALALKLLLTITDVFLGLM